MEVEASNTQDFSPDKPSASPPKRRKSARKKKWSEVFVANSPSHVLRVGHYVLNRDEYRNVELNIDKARDRERVAQFLYASEAVLGEGYEGVVEGLMKHTWCLDGRSVYVFA